jgi:hypothetical protein
MARQADVRSLCFSRKYGADLANATFEDLRNPNNRYALFMSSRPIFIDWLRKNRLLAASMSCDMCGLECKLTARSKAIDGCTWRCPNRQETSIRHLTVFAGSHMHLEDVFNLSSRTPKEHLFVKACSFRQWINCSALGSGGAKLVRTLL